MRDGWEATFLRTCERARLPYSKLISRKVGEVARSVGLCLPQETRKFNPLPYQKLHSALKQVQIGIVEEYI